MIFHVLAVPFLALMESAVPRDIEIGPTSADLALQAEFGDGEPEMHGLYWFARFLNIENDVLNIVRCILSQKCMLQQNLKGMIKQFVLWAHRA
jgi:hypothetical protein